MQERGAQLKITIETIVRRGWQAILSNFARHVEAKDIAGRPL
jgi:hypothetical protein